MMVLAAVILLALGARAEAVPLTIPDLGEPSNRYESSQHHRLTIGAEYEHTLRRELEKADVSDNTLKRYEAVYAKFQYDLHPLANPYVRLGVGEVAHKLEDFFVQGIGRRDLSFESDWGFTWGGGISGGVRLPWGFRTGYDVSYQTLTADAQKVTHADDTLLFSRRGSNVSGEMRWREYQATAWLSHPIDLEGSILTPYFGAKWSRLRLDDHDVAYSVTDAGTTQNLTIDQTSYNVFHWGAVAGLRLVYDKRLVLVVEGHEIDDESVIGSVHWIF